MKPATKRALQNAFERAVREISADELKPSLATFSDGIVTAIEGVFAAVRLGDPEASPTPGFYVPPGLAIAVGDHVWLYHLGGFRLVVLNLTRISFPPPEVPPVEPGLDLVWVGADPADIVTIEGGEQVWIG